MHRTFHLLLYVDIDAAGLYIINHLQCIKQTTMFNINKRVD